MNLEKGGREAIERMVEAYGYTTKQALCDHLGVSKSTLATRYMRDSFPAEWVIQCALETGASLKWLVSGEGVKFESNKSDVVIVPKKNLLDGKMLDASHLLFDKAFLPNDIVKPLFVQDEGKSYIAEESYPGFSDGKWLINFDKKFFIRDVIQIPNNKIRVISNGISFDSKLSDIKLIARVKISIL